MINVQVTSNKRCRFSFYSWCSSYHDLSSCFDSDIFTFLFRGNRSDHFQVHLYRNGKLTLIQKLNQRKYIFNNQKLIIVIVVVLIIWQLFLYYTRIFSSEDNVKRLSVEHIAVSRQTKRRIVNERKAVIQHADERKLPINQADGLVKRFFFAFLWMGMRCCYLSYYINLFTSKIFKHSTRHLTKASYYTSMYDRWIII
jgi:hypothetical protein